jgi:hypothetical protein
MNNNNNTISILHLSDLHKSKNWDLSNQVLLTSLLYDLDRYLQEDPKIKAPDCNRKITVHSFW